MLRYLHTAVRNVAQTAVCNGAGFSAISRFRNIALFAQYRIRQLRHEQALVSSDDLGATGRRLLRFDFADQLAFVRISGQQNAGHAEIMERLQYRIVHGSARTAGSAGHHHMQSQIGGLRQIWHQRTQRVASAGGDQIVIVDQHVNFRTRPPGTVAQLFGSHVLARNAGFQEFRKRVETFRSLFVIGQVRSKMRLRNLRKIRTTIIQHENFCFFHPDSFVRFR